MADDTCLALADEILKNDSNEDETEIAALDEIDKELEQLYESENSSTKSMDSDWSDEPRVEIGLQMQKIYPYLLTKSKSEKNDHSQIHLSFSDIVKLRFKIAKQFIRTYKMTTLIAMRDVTEFCKLSIQEMQQKSNSQIVIPSTMSLAHSMLLWQSDPIYTSLTSHKLRPEIEEKLQKYGPKMFKDIQFWMEDSSDKLKSNEQSVSAIFEWIKLCQNSKEFGKYFSNELFIQITKQLSANPINESVRRGLRLLYLFLLYCRPSKDVFMSTKYKICTMVLENIKVRKLYSFSTIDDSVGCILDIILFIQEFHPICDRVEFTDVYALRIKDDINKQSEFYEVLKQPKSLNHVQTLNNPSKSELKHSIYLSFQKAKMNHSMTNFTASYCGTADKAKMLTKVSMKMFEDLLKLMRIVSVSEKERTRFDPSHKLQQLILICQQQKLLRDEIYYQLIKQITNNTDKLSLLLGWKIIFIALKYVLPRKHTLQILQCLSAKVANATYTKHSVNIPQIAHHIFIISTEYIWQIEHNKVKSLPKPKKQFILQIFGEYQPMIRVQIYNHTRSIQYDLAHNCTLQWLAMVISKRLGIKLTAKESGLCVDVVISGSDLVRKEVKAMIIDNSSLEIFRQTLLKWKQSTPTLKWAYLFRKKQWSNIDWNLLDQQSGYIDLVYHRLCEDIKSKKIELETDKYIKMYAIQTMLANKGKIKKFHQIKAAFIKNMIVDACLTAMSVESWQYKLSSYGKKLADIIGISVKSEENDSVKSEDYVNLLKLIFSCYLCWNHTNYGLSLYFVTIVKGGTKFVGNCAYLVVNHSFIGIQDRNCKMVWKSDSDNIVKIQYQIISELLSVHVIDYEKNQKHKFVFRLRPNQGHLAYNKVKEMMDLKKELSTTKDVQNECTECKCTIMDSISNNAWVCVICRKRMTHKSCFEKVANKDSTKRDKMTWSCNDCKKVCQEFVNNRSFESVAQNCKLYYLRFVISSYFDGA